MNSLSVASAVLALVFSVSCGRPTSMTAAGPSSSTMPAVAPPLAMALVPLLSGSRHITGIAGPVSEGRPPCFAQRYPCEVYNFSLLQEGAIEVAVTWEGSPRALLVQLYWAGEGLAHEDVAPRDGPSRIYFRRPRMEAANYDLRIVNLEPTSAIPFTLSLAH